MKRLHIFIPEDMLDHIDLIARNRGVSKATAIRSLLSQSLLLFPIYKEPKIDGHPTNGRG